MFDDVGGKTGDQKFARVAGDAGGADADLRRIADLVDLDHEIDVVLGDAGRSIGEGHQFFGQQDDLAGSRRIDLGIAQRAAARPSRDAVGIAEFIGGRDAEEGDIEGQLAAVDQFDPSAMGMDVDRLVHQAVRDGFGQLAAHAGSVDAPDHAAFDVGDQRRIAG